MSLPAMMRLKSPSESPMKAQPTVMKMLETKMTFRYPTVPANKPETTAPSIWLTLTTLAEIREVQISELQL